MEMLILEFSREIIMRKFRFHLLGLAHLPPHRKYSSCAFTQKNLKLSKMLTSLGHDVFMYGSAGGDAIEYVDDKNFHMVETHAIADIREDFGVGDNRFEIGYNWHREQFKHDITTGPKNKSSRMLIENSIAHINRIKKDDDFILRTMGWWHNEVVDGTGLKMDIESGIGYRGSQPSSNGHKRYRVFESHSMMEYSYGHELGITGPGGNGNFYDRVIPNYFDPNDFEFKAQKEEYILFIGRMITRKGIFTAIETGKALNMKVILAGQGARVTSDGYLVDSVGEFRIAPSVWEYVGFAGPEKRKKLYANAAITMVPTEYLEPFGGTNVESRLSGTPVLTTDFGGFPEQITNGVDGYRCSTLDDFVYYAKELLSWEPWQRKIVRERAERYLMDNVKWDYQRFFEDIYDLHYDKGWPLIREETPEFRKRIHW